MIWWGLLLRSEALLARQPAFWRLGLILAFGAGVPTNALPAVWGSLINPLDLLLLLWLVPRATAAVLLEANRVDGGGQPRPFPVVWQAGAARAWAVRRVFILFILLGLLLGLVLVAILFSSMLQFLLALTPAPDDNRALLGSILLTLAASLLDLLYPAVVLDRLAFWPAIRRAWGLLRHHPGTTLGVLLLATLVAGLGAGLSAAIKAFAHLPTLASGLDNDLSAAAVLATGLLWLVHTLADAPFALLELLLWALFYRDYRPLPVLAPIPAAAPEGAPTAPLPEAVGPAWPLAPVAPHRWLVGVGIGAGILALATLALQQVGTVERASSHTADVPSQVIVQQPGLLYGVALSPDERLLATCTGNLFAVDHAVRLWSLGGSSNKPPRVWSDPQGCNAVAFSPDGTLLAAGFDGGAVRVWDMTQPEPAPRVVYTARSDVKALAFGPDSRQVAIGTLHDGVLLWDAHHPDQPPIHLPSGSDDARQIAWTADGRRLAAADGRGLLVWDLSRPLADPLRAAATQDRLVNSVAWTPDGVRLITGETEVGGARRRFLTVRDGTSPASVLMSVQVAGDRDVMQLAASSDGRLVAGAGARVVLIDPRHPEAGPVYLPGGGSVVYAVVFGAGGRTLVATELGGTVRRWILPAGDLIPTPSPTHAP